MNTIQAIAIALGLAVLGTGPAHATGTHNLYVHNIFGDWQSNSNLLLWSVTFDCNPGQYSVDYSYTPYPSALLTVAFTGPFTDRPCTKYPFLGEDFYFTGTLTFSVENFQAPEGVCTVPFAMGWGEPTFGIKRHYGKTIGPMACTARNSWYSLYKADAYTWAVAPCATCSPIVTTP